MPRQSSKKILILVVSILSLNASKAQDFSIIGGANLARVYQKTEGSAFSLYDHSSKIGYHLGFAIDNQIKGNFSLTSELSFSRIGTNAKLSERFTRGSSYNPFWGFDDLHAPVGGGIPKNNTHSLYYTFLSIQLKYEVFNNTFLKLGPQIGYNLLNQSKESEMDIYMKQRWDLGPVLGIEYAISNKYHMSFNSYSALTKLNSHSGNGFSYESKNQYIELRLHHYLK